MARDERDEWDVQSDSQRLARELYPLLFIIEWKEGLYKYTSSSFYKNFSFCMYTLWKGSAESFQPYKHTKKETQCQRKRE